MKQKTKIEDAHTRRHTHSHTQRERDVSIVVKHIGTYTYAEHESDLGTHSDDASRHKARHAAILTDAFRQLRRTAQRTAEYAETCIVVTYKRKPYTNVSPIYSNYTIGKKYKLSSFTIPTNGCSRKNTSLTEFLSSNLYIRIFPSRVSSFPKEHWWLGLSDTELSLAKLYCRERPTVNAEQSETPFIGERSVPNYLTWAYSATPDPLSDWKEGDNKLPLARPNLTSPCPSR